MYMIKVVGSSTQVFVGTKAGARRALYREIRKLLAQLRALDK